VAQAETLRMDKSGLFHDGIMRAHPSMRH
jgi:hypothetical protein